ncbi:MAG: cation transporter substrate-binding protein [Acidimicrobiaceae bacterium]|nr:cation transporter substrate-binding protein [Acidimicrobiaceae bacterium]
MGRTRYNRIGARLLVLCAAMGPTWWVAASGSGASTAEASTAGASAAVASRRAAAKITVVAAENEYGDVAAQVGGKYVTVDSVESNPNTDPHTYEVSPGVAREVASAQLVIQNGVGYDAYMSKVESASASSSRTVIVVQKLLGLPDNTANPHLWYSPKTMPIVANRLAGDLAKLQPAHAAYFKANASKFVASLKPWLDAIASFKAKYGGTKAATTEPVADYLLSAMGIDNATPFSFQADIMNGVDPSPQSISLESGFLAKHKVKLFAYNQQVVDALTTSIRNTAQNAGIPVVGVYETMPTPGYDYQSWMLAEVHAIETAVTKHTSTEHL